MPLMDREIRGDVEDDRPGGVAREQHGRSRVMGGLDRGVRVQVAELDRTEQLGIRQGDDVTYLTEGARAAGVFDSEGAIELALQGSIVARFEAETSGPGEAPEHGSAPP